MENFYANLGILLVLILINGLFSMSEMSVVSSTKARLQKRVFERRLGAKAAYALHEEPTHFLSTVQVGITVVGILCGAFGGEALQTPIAEILARMPGLSAYSETLALIATVALITYFSVVLGELVPKRLALQNPEAIASAIARPMQVLALMVSPLVWLLSASSRLLLTVFGMDRVRDNMVTDEEIRIMMEMGSEAGVFHADESQLVNNVMKLDALPVRAIMVPRKKIYLIDLTEPPEQQRMKIENSPYSRIVVCKGGFDRVLGYVNCRDLLKALLANPDFQLEASLKPLSYVQETMTLTQLLKQFRETRSDLSLVVDEYGDIEGLLTATDLLTAIVGELPAVRENQPFECVQRSDGSWLVDGDMPVSLLKTTLGIKQTFPGETGNHYHTLAGMMLFNLQKLPHTGDSCLISDGRFEVVDMDGSRIDKVLIVPARVEH